MKAKLLILFCCLLFSAVHVYGQYGPYDWPMVKGCRERTSWARHETELGPPFDIQTYAQVSMGPDMSYFDGMLAIGEQYRLFMFEPATETVLWTFDVPGAGGSMSCTPAFADSLILCGGQGGDGLFALNKYSGLEIWSRPIGSLYTRNPVPDGDRVYVVQDSLYCFDLRDGSTLWTFDVGGQLTPAADDSNVYIGRAGTLYCLDKWTGNVKWEVYNTGGADMAVDSLCIYIQHLTSLVARHKSDGSIQWSSPFPEGYLMWLNEGSIAISDSFVCYVYYQSSEGKVGLFTLDKITGSSLWHHTFDGDWSYSPRIANGIVYLVDGPNYDLWAFDLKTGNTVFFDDSEEYWYDPIFAEHTMFIQTISGGLKAFRKAATSVEIFEAAEPPKVIRLLQNYPNPFNPSTDIRYQIPDVGLPVHTTLRVYNILGQEVRTLVDKVQEAGYFNVTWDGKDNLGKNVTSGIYMYRLQAGDVTETREMILLK
jgi:outer membrane protein assembly factor BamB